LDVGANIGQYTLLAAAMGFKVFAFEPVPNHVEMIRRSLYLNGWPDRVHLYQNGIADYRDKVIINLHKDNQGGATIEKIASKEDETQTDFRFQARQTIDLVTFNDVLPEIDRYYPDLDIVFWKADIEGYEPRMFRGASNLLSQKKIPLILIEVLGKSFARTKCNMTEFFHSLFNMGYNIKSPQGINFSPKDIALLIEDSYSSEDTLKALTRDFVLIHNSTKITWY